MSTTTTPHLVAMLLVTRREFLRALEGLKPFETQVRIGGLNSIGWAIGHVAWQESLFWLSWGQGGSIPERLMPFGTGCPGTVPDYAQVIGDWHEVARATEPFLRSLDDEHLRRHFTSADTDPVVQEILARENAGTLLTRCIMHYWSHIGEIACVRSLLGHRGPEFVGLLRGCHYGE
jgi:hypothetical protein